MKKILTIDQGTTSSRSIIFNNSFDIINESQQEYALSFPKDGWVEADADDILNSVKKTLDCVIEASRCCDAAWRRVRGCAKDARFGRIAGLGRSI